MKWLDRAIVKRERKNKNPEHAVWDGGELYSYACRCSEEVPEIETTTRTSINRNRSWAWKSKMSDRGIETLLNSGEYTFGHMAVIHNPYRYAPLTALLVFVTEKEQRVRVAVQDELGFSYTTAKPGIRHRLPVFALKAGTENKVLVELLPADAGPVTASQTLTLITYPLPKFLENMVTVGKKKTKSALPLIFVYGGDTKYPYAFDEEGQIRYYMSYPPKAYGLFPMSGGRFLYLVHNISAPAFANPHSVLGYEMDLLGRTHREFYVEDGIHHDGCEMVPGGNIMTVSSSMEKYVEDAIIEVGRTDGKIVKKMCLADILSDHPYFDMFDWAHINTISYLPEDHSILLCARNLHSAMKIDWETFELKWILCDPEFWKGTPYEDKVLKPKEGMAYFYQAHAAYMLDKKTRGGRDRMIVFDNHWAARRPIDSFDGDKLSYVRIYAIDEKSGEVELLNSYASRKSKIRSNGIIKGGRIFSMSGYLNKPVNEFEGMINEYSRKNGKVLNRYLTYNSFYRAYPFFVDLEEYVKPMDHLPDYILGAAEQPLEACEVDVAGAKPVPLIKKKYQKVRERKLVRKDVRSRQWREDRPEYELKNDLGEIYAKMYDRFLLLYGRDHVIEKVYFVGKSHSYVKDFSATEQRTPQLFAESRYYIAVPLCGLEADNYDLYFQCRGGLYRLRKSIEVTEPLIGKGS